MTVPPPAASLPPLDPLNHPTSATARIGEITGPAVLCIGVGGMGALCCGIGQLVGSFLGQAQSVRLADGTLLQQDPGVIAFAGTIALADLVSSIALIVVGVAALRGMPFARRAGIGIAIAMIVIALVYVVGTALYAGPAREAYEQRAAATSAQASASQPTTAPAAPQPLAPFASAGTFLSGAAIFLVRVFVPILILTLWTRSRVRRAFEGA